MPGRKQVTVGRDRTSIPSWEDLLNSSFSGRKLEKELKICEIARQILFFCYYRRAADHYCYVRPTAQHAVVGARRGQPFSIVVDLANPMRWYAEVYRQGLAKVQSHFILDLVEELKDGRLLLLACGQGRGCGLRIRLVLARHGRRGWEPDSKNLPVKHSPKPYPLTYTQTDDYYRLAMLRLASRSIDAVLKNSFTPNT